ncbi:MAG: 3-methyl-2-oxobutanoate hydroxymethyltransferase [Lentisphaeria bacterium]|nr:3-methyl-2-oxobutanoate hydroxymethyltransferase [Lentisphaeria bacterium]
MAQTKKITVSQLRKMKQEGRKIVMLTAYDAPTAALAAECGIDLLLVGDSLGMCVLGYRDTLQVTLEESLHHCRAVRRGAPDAFIIGDMPFMTMHTSERDALLNAARYIQEAGCDAVKIEGDSSLAPTVARMVHAGIPVMGHVGLLPQHIKTAGGYRISGKTEDSAARVLQDAKNLEEAGAFAIVMECVPAELARKITDELSIPTIGIGAGPYCSGQVQVVNDTLGLFAGPKPRHAKRYADLSPEIRRAFTAYAEEVRGGVFPGEEHSF